MSAKVTPTAWRVGDGGAHVGVVAGPSVSVSLSRGVSTASCAHLSAEGADALADVLRAAAAVVRGEDAPVRTMDAGERDRMALDLAAVSRAVTERRPGETLAQAVTRARVERDAAVCEVSRLRGEVAALQTDRREAVDDALAVRRQLAEAQAESDGRANAVQALKAQLAQADAKLREVQP